MPVQIQYPADRIKAAVDKVTACASSASHKWIHPNGFTMVGEDMNRAVGEALRTLI